MTILPVSNLNYGLKPQVTNKIAFKGEANSSSSEDVSSAKTFATIAAAGSIGSLALSGLMLKKASDLEKLSKPVSKITEFVSNYYKNVGMDKAFNVVLKVYKESADKVGETIKNLAPLAKKINEETNPEKIAELNKEFSKKIVDIVSEFVKVLDKKYAKDINEAIDSPYIDILKATQFKNAGVDKGFLDNLGTELEKFVKDSETLNSPNVKKFIEDFLTLKNQRMMNALEEVKKNIPSENLQ